MNGGLPMNWRQLGSDGRIAWMTRFSCCFLALLLMAFGKQANAQPLNAQQVRKSIERGVNYLLSKQDGKGQWRGTLENGFPQGLTALTTLALLNAGVEPDHPQMAKAIETLISRVPNDRLMTYVCALRLMVLTTADPDGKRYRREIQRDVDWLVSRQVKQGSSTGGWSYPRGPSMTADGSNSQFALLALHEASRSGATIPRAVWQRAIEYWPTLRGRASFNAWIPRCNDNSGIGLAVSPTPLREAVMARSV